MREERSVSSSEQYIKKSNRRLLFIGLGIGLLFLIVAGLLSQRQKAAPEESVISYELNDFERRNRATGDIASFPGATAELTAEPASVNMDNVILGSNAEALITLTAKNAPIVFLGRELAEAQQDGFMLEGSCQPNTTIETGKNCIVRVLWNPASLRQIQNTLTIRWREDSPSVFQEQSLTIPLRGQSTDSKDCVICEDVRAEAAKKPRLAAGLNGEIFEMESDGTVLVDGNVITPTANGLLIKDGMIVGIEMPKKIPMSIDNKIIGSIDEAQNVISPEGEKLGRLLGDDTIVDSSLNVLGAAIPVVSVMDDEGRVIAKMREDGAVVDATDTVVGRPLVDGSVVDLEGARIGTLRPWGLVINFSGDVIGGIVPDGTISTSRGAPNVIQDGSVVNAANQTVATIKPSGLAVSSQGELIGAVVPMGVAVGASCQSLGTIQINGQVKDQYEQIIGKVLLDGSVVDADGNELGASVAQGLVINEKGVVLGFVNSEGKAVDAKGAVIGCVNPDGTISAGKKQIGAVMEKGRVVGSRCRIIGSVYPDGSVVSDVFEAIGRVRADKYVANANGRLIGAVVPRGTAIAEGCRLLGLITLQGQVVDPMGMTVGCVTASREVVNAEYEVIGAVAPKGLVVDNSGKVIGRIRLDGKVVNKEGRVIGCINPDGSVTPLNGAKFDGAHILDKNASGVILDANGEPTGWSLVGNTAYDASAQAVGKLQPNGWVLNARGSLIGIVHPDGVIFSADGLILGRYSKQTGMAVNQNGDRFGRVLPDMTVVNGDKTAILGVMIPDQTAFMDLNGVYIGTMRIDGMLKNAADELVGAIKADGSVVDRSGKMVAMRIPSGRVLNALGREIGTVSAKGDVLSAGKTKIGRVLGNGLAVSNDDRVLGIVSADIALPIGVDGLLGSVGYDGSVLDKSGRRIGSVSPFGPVLGSDGKLLGQLVRIGSYVNADNRLIGWSSFGAEVLAADGSAIADILPGGMAFNRDDKLVGSLIPRGTVVDEAGRFLNRVSPTAGVLNASTEVIGTFKASPYLFGEKQGISGRLLKPGVAVDSEGKLIGWTRYDGMIEKGATLVGRVGLDNRVISPEGAVLGVYVPVGTLAVGNGEMLGLVDTDGYVVSLRGERQGQVMAPDLVAADGKIVGRLLLHTDMTAPMFKGGMAGQTAADGRVTEVRGGRQTGTLAATGFVSDMSKTISGGLVPVGLPLSPTLSVLGQSLMTGDVVSASMTVDTAAFNKALFSARGSLAGYMAEPTTFINRNGALIGYSSGRSAIVDRAGKKVAEQMCFGSALSSDNLWAGGALPGGQAVTDDAIDIGTVSADGVVMGKDNEVMGRALTDGSVAGVLDRTTFTTMPYIGKVVKQGLPFSYRNEVIGRTTMAGDVVDAAAKKLFRILDDGTILGTDTPLVGAVLSFNTAVNNKGELLGTLTGNGAVLRPDGSQSGKIAVNGVVKGAHVLEMFGAIIPESLVVNDCKVVGQTGFDGQVITGRGDVAGRIQTSKWAVDTQGRQIGRVVRFGPVMSPEGDYLGRTLPDSTVVDLNGVNMGCARNDGSVVDNAGNLVGHVVERGLVVDENGNILGRVKANGDVVDAEGRVIGKVLGDGKGTVVDNDGKVLGRVITPDEEVVLGEDGRVTGTLSRDGKYRDAEGNVVFEVDEDGRITKDGREIGFVRDGKLYDTKGNESDGTFLVGLDGSYIGMVSGCDIVNENGDKIAKIYADGTIRDLTGQLYASINGEMLLNPKGEPMGKLVGLTTRLDKCGVASGGQGQSSGRRIFIGDKTFEVTPTGSLVDKSGTIVGYMGEDGRPYSLDDRLLTNLSRDGRQRPNLEQKMEVHPEQIDQMQQLLAQRRQNMRKGITSLHRLLPDGKTLARAKPKQDADWGLPRIVSSYPVDMSRMILKDKAIPAVLVRAIDSRYTDVPVTAIVERHIYAEEGRNIIIPAGSRLIGQAEANQGENRVAKLEITWSRLIRPDGAAFQFQATSGDAQGRGGVAAYLDEQLLKKYGKPLLSSAITSAVSMLMATNDKVSTDENGTKTQSSISEAASDSRESFIDSMSQIFNQLLNEATEIPVVVYVPAGTRLTVFSNEDLWLRMESDDERDYEEEYGAPSTMAQGTSGGNWEAGRSQEVMNGAASIGMTGQAIGSAAMAPTTEGQYYDPALSVNNPSTGASLPGAQPAQIMKPAANGNGTQPIYNGQNSGVATQPSLNRVAQPVLPQNSAGSNSGKMF